MRRPSARRAPALALLAALALAACDFEQVIDLDLPPHQPSLVVGAFPTPDSVFAARIGRTTSVLGRGLRGADLLVRDARVVVLSEDGALLDSLRYVAPAQPWGTGEYRSARGLAPVPGVRYRLVAEAPGLPAARAETVLPAAIPVAATLVQGGSGPQGGGTYRLEVTFADPGGDRVFHLRVTEPYARHDGMVAYRPVPFSSSEPVLRASFAELDQAVTFDFDRPAERPLFWEAVFRNAAFRGQARTIVLDVETQPGWGYRGGGEGGQGGMPHVFTVTLATLSSDYARYQQTLALQQRVGDNPFAEPVPLHRNVEGGHGVFAGYTVSRADVAVE